MSTAGDEAICSTRLSTACHVMRFRVEPCMANPKAAYRSHLQCTVSRTTCIVDLLQHKLWYIFTKECKTSKGEEGGEGGGGQGVQTQRILFLDTTVPMGMQRHLPTAVY